MLVVDDDAERSSADERETSRSSTQRLDPAEQAMRSRLMTELFGDDPEPVKIGRYVVIERLGQGGVGVVYEAYDPRLDRKVALKLIRGESGHSQAEVEARLEREAKAMAKLDHAHVVTVHDVGRDPRGIYIAMELVRGQTLSGWLRESARSWTQIRNVMRDAAMGLSAAHGVGLVHCDIKPGNIMVDGRGRGRVVDFGLAKAVAKHDSEPRAKHGLPPSAPITVTQTGTIAGTPAYMAPEQFRGEVLDARVDQWAFCVTLFEALYGHRPFGGTSVDEIRGNVSRHQLTEPADPGAAPRWMLPVIIRGLALDPNDRWSSLAELVHELGRDGRSRRRAWTLASVAATGGAMATAAMLWLVEPQPSDAERERVRELVAKAEAAAAKRCFVYPSADAGESDTAYTWLVELERLADDGSVLANEESQRLRRSFATRMRELGDTYWEQPDTLPFAADFYAHTLVFDPEDVVARQRTTLTPGQLSVLRKHARAAEFSPLQRRGAEVLRALAQPDDAERTRELSKVVASADNAVPWTTRVGLQSLLPATNGTGSEHHFESPRRTPAPAVTGDASQQASLPELASAPRAKSTRDPSAARNAVESGRSAYRTGQFDHAEAHFHRALALDRRSEAAFVGLAELYFERGAYDKALQFARRGVAVAPKSAALRMALGDAYFKVLRYKEARSEYEAAQRFGHRDAAPALQRLDRRVGVGE